MLNDIRLGAFNQSLVLILDVVLSFHELPTNVLFAALNSRIQASTQRSAGAVNDLLQDIYRSLERYERDAILTCCRVFDVV
jgi:hypothetical protein